MNRLTPLSWAFALIVLGPHGTPTYAESTATTSEAAISEAEYTEEERAYIEWATGIAERLSGENGAIPLPAAGATLSVPDAYYFLDAEESRLVLEEVWGNPPGQPVLGMLFPDGMTPFDEDAWGVTVEFVDDGYVSDEDAADIDYDELLSSMQADTASESSARVDAGYGAIELVGWAAAPFYDEVAKKLHWAQEIAFEGAPENTLNYNIRVLGREGFLRMNFIAGMSQLETIQANVEDVLNIAEFDAGKTYADFDPSIDKVAAYGIGALVAGKVLAKTGLFAAALVFLKKFGVFILVGLGALASRFFKRRGNESETA